MPLEGPSTMLDEETGFSSDSLASILKNTTLNNLFSVLSRVYTNRNLLVLDQDLSSVINYLTPFSKLKEHGKFDKIFWFKSLPTSEHELESLLSQFDSLIIVISPLHQNLVDITSFWNRILGLVTRIRINIIYPNLSRNYLYELNSHLNSKLDFNKIINLQIDQVNNFNIKLNPYLKVINWVVSPFEIEDNVVSLILPLGGLLSYFNQPIEQLSKLSDLLIELIKTNGQKDSKFHGNFIKFKNIYGKGDHSKLLIKLITNEKFPQFLNENLSNLEQDFYLNKLSGNADLIVLERNLDYFPLLFNQLNYQGLIDDLFTINDELNQAVTIDNSNYKLTDELYQNLKDLNFASIGIKLNQLAKFIQSKFQQHDKLNDLKEIKNLVNNLGDLTNKQDLIKKHTTISESILNFIEKNDTGKFNQYEFFLKFQNDLFDLDYKEQLNFVVRFLDENFNSSIILSSIILISLVNDGIKEKDFELLQLECFQNYSIEFTLKLDKLIESEIIKIIPHSGNDFLGALTGYSLGGGGATNSTNQASHNNTSTPSTSTSDLVDYDDVNKVGISGLQNIFKSNYTLINKFWNIHPLIEEEFEQYQSRQLQAGATTTDKDDAKSGLFNEYPHPSFALPSNTVPILCRLVEALYFRDFLKYKPINNLRRRPNWDNLGLDTMFKGKTTDMNICDNSDTKTDKTAKNKPTEYVVIIIIGGITRSEMSTFKYLQQKLDDRGINKQIIVLTSGIVNNRKFIEYLET